MITNLLPWQPKMCVTANDFTYCWTDPFLLFHNICGFDVISMNMQSGGGEGEIEGTDV